MTVLLVLFLVAVMHYSAGSERRVWSIVPVFGLILAVIYYAERGRSGQVSSLHWETAMIETVICLSSGWLMWRAQLARRGHGAQLLAGIFLLALVVSVLVSFAHAEETKKEEGKTEKPTQEQLIKNLEKTLTGARLVGQFTITGGVDRPPTKEGYIISLAQKVPEGDLPPGLPCWRATVAKCGSFTRIWFIP